MRTLVVAVHEGTDQLACVHLAESEEELNEVLAVAASLGPVLSFPIQRGEPVQYWAEVQP